MAFKLTYSDGQETDYDDDTAWEVHDGVLKMGHKEGIWTVLVSPSHWAVIEVDGAKSRDSDESSADDESTDDSEANDHDSDEGSDHQASRSDDKDDEPQH